MKTLAAPLLAMLMVLSPGFAGFHDAEPESEASPTPPEPLAAGLDVVGDCLASRPTGLIEMDAAGAGSIFNDVFGCTDTIVSPSASADTADTLNVVAAGLAARLGAVLLAESDVEAHDDPVEGLAQWIVIDEPTTPTAPPVASGDPSPTASGSPHPSPSSSSQPRPEPLRIVGRDATELAIGIRSITHDTRVVFVDARDSDRLAEGLRLVARSGGILLPAPDTGLDELRRSLAMSGFDVVTVSDTDDAEAGTVAAPSHPLDGRELWVGVDHDFASAHLSIPVIEALSRPIDVRMIEGDPREAHGLADGRGPVTLRWFDPSDTVEAWQFQTVLAGQQLPGGGFTLFPHRRFVAMYGHPEFGGLGVLGEQGPEAAVERVRQIAAPYEEGDVPVVPAFDIITTLASGGPTPDGDYSAPLDKEVLRPWIEAATAAGLYVVLDFQPGRSSYMDQVPLYEEFLLQPNVGVALDPEWRLGPNEVHLQQIGSVATSEINEVADYLSGLVREHALPQKLLVIHQFRLSMIRDREQLVHPAELAVMIHMDGQGPIATKGETYAAITAGFEDRVWWGWKNFYDEDSPTPSPEHTMSREPAPLFVSYQ